MPLPLFFAEDKISFYKVMSDTKGYKHIHYVKDVSYYITNAKYSNLQPVVGVECCTHYRCLVKGKATPVTSGKWEVIYISKLTTNAM